MINWQGHPKGSSPNSYTTATSNYVGVLRDRVEAALDCESLFFLSGSGNVNNNSQIPEEAAIAENYIILGEKLAEHAVEAEGYIRAAFEPYTDGEYINTTPGDLTACTPVQNGFYRLVLVDGSKIRVFLALNEEVAHQVLQQTTVKPLFNEQHVIVGLAE